MCLALTLMLPATVILESQFSPTMTPPFSFIHFPSYCTYREIEIACVCFVSTCLNRLWVLQGLEGIEAEKRSVVLLELPTRRSSVQPNTPTFIMQSSPSLDAKLANFSQGLSESNLSSFPNLSTYDRAS